MSETVHSDPFGERISTIRGIIEDEGYGVADEDLQRPWGGFFRLDNNDAERFIDKYFADIKEKFETFEGLSPKFLIVGPGLRLSWQVHGRRNEIWRVLDGPVGVKLSPTDDEPNEVTVLQDGELIQFDAGTRHRLIGMGGWGIVVEIWQHTDPANPSDESDIVRVQDDFAR